MFGDHERVVLVQLGDTGLRLLDGEADGEAGHEDHDEAGNDQHTSVTIASLNRLHSLDLVPTIIKPPISSKGHDQLDSTMSELRNAGVLDFQHVRNIIEIHTDAEDVDLPIACANAALKAASVFRAQPYRTWFSVLLLSPRRARMLHFDRADLLCYESFDPQTDIHLLLLYLARTLHGSLEDLGGDSRDQSQYSLLASRSEDDLFSRGTAVFLDPRNVGDERCIKISGTGRSSQESGRHRCCSSAVRS
jgi:hypothetical protein